MPYEREKRQAKDGTWYYVVKPKRPTSGVRGLFYRYFGPPSDDEFQRHTAMGQMGEVARWLCNPLGGRHKKSQGHSKEKGG